jgi:trk system potassium uptake protein TrkA
VSPVEERIEAARRGRAVRDLPLPDGCTLAAVIRRGEVLAPRGDTVLRAGDELIAVARADQQARLSALLRRG